MPKYKFSEIAYNITDKKMPDPGDEELYIGLEHLDSGSLRVTRWGSEVELVGQKLVMQKGDILFLSGRNFLITSFLIRLTTMSSSTIDFGNLFFALV